MERKTEKVKEFLKGKGFIGALILSIGAVGISAYMAYDNAISEIEKTGTIPPSTAIVQNNVSNVEKEPEATSVTTTARPVEKPETSIPKSEQEVNHFVPATEKHIHPVEDAEVLQKFSNGELVKSETLGVWKTHDGVDYACAFGTEVKAICSGTVKKIKNDALWGITVTIEHEDGSEAVYCGLDKSLTVKESAKVKCGEIIGKTAEFDAEAKMKPHLHLGVKKSDKWIDPEEFIGS